MALNKPEYLIIHHTGGTNANPLADTSHHTLESIKHWHVKGRGWDDVGYHYVIEKDGRLRKGRPEKMHGAHAKGYNTKSLGVCLSGNFDLTEPTKEQAETLKGLLGDLRRRYNIPVENIIPHRAVANKTCYGMNLKDNWAQQLSLESEQIEPCSLSTYTTMELVNELLSRVGL